MEEGGIEDFKGKTPGCRGRRPAPSSGLKTFEEGAGKFYRHSKEPQLHLTSLSFGVSLAGHNSISRTPQGRFLLFHKLV